MRTSQPSPTTSSTLMRTFTKVRSRSIAAAAQDVERSAHIVLRFVANEGPMRATAVAEGLQSDPSTVSRQVAALVKHGLLERRADQDDGRASLLVAHRARRTPSSPSRTRCASALRPACCRAGATRDLRRFAALLAAVHQRLRRASENPTRSPRSPPSAASRQEGTPDVRHRGRPRAGTPDTGELTPQADPDDPVRAAARHVPGRAGPDDRLHGDPHASATTCNGLSVQAWVTTAFLITSTISTPLFGKLSDIYGRKTLFLIGDRIFIIGSALCGLATNMYMLAAFRAFQGIGAGGLFPLALAIIGDIVPPRERARYQGYFMAVFATSSRSRPGGRRLPRRAALDPRASPAGAGSSTSTCRSASSRSSSSSACFNSPHHRHEPPHRLDWRRRADRRAGAVAGHRRAGPHVGLGLGRSAGLLPGRHRSAWSASSGSRRGWATTRCSRCGCSATASSPSGRSQSVVIGIGMFGGIASIPLYLQIVKGASPTKAGLLLLPLVAGDHGRRR